ncbi:unnamed protein product [Litomosoides sigmodontis]|uniref:Uncharacterized protein n=1 Tax=Litomosoides sigmodontis TaxID=42156 RepID=A0A3P6TGR2_LITSI|nr:unnamed protein product [Litomosoides sigmodontis]
MGDIWSLCLGGVGFIGELRKRVEVTGRLNCASYLPNAYDALDILKDLANSRRWKLQIICLLPNEKFDHNAMNEVKSPKVLFVEAESFHLSVDHHHQQLFVLMLRHEMELKKKRVVRGK